MTQILFSSHPCALSQLCFDATCEVEERDSRESLLLDVATTNGRVAHIITDGLAGMESRTSIGHGSHAFQQEDVCLWFGARSFCSQVFPNASGMMPLFGLLAKSQREADFPVEILRKGLAVDIVQATASKPEDKDRILNSICSHPERSARMTRTQTLESLSSTPPEQHPNYDRVNRALASHFSLAAWFGSVAKARDVSPLLRALAADPGRSTLQLSVTGCMQFRDEELASLLRHLPRELRTLRLDLAFTSLEAPLDWAAVEGSTSNHDYGGYTGTVPGTRWIVI